MSSTKQNRNANSKHRRPVLKIKEFYMALREQALKQFYTDRYLRHWRILLINIVDSLKFVKNMME